MTWAKRTNTAWILVLMNSDEQARTKRRKSKADSSPAMRTIFTRGAAGLTLPKIVADDVRRVNLFPVARHQTHEGLAPQNEWLFAARQLPAFRAAANAG
jgi:hypothetical protein